MNYRRRNAKDHARAHFKGIWAAALTPFAPDLALDEAGLRRNLRHWVDDLGIDGVFVCGKQGEFFSMSVAERKRSFDIAVEELGGHRTILSCSDQNLDTVIDLAKHAHRSALTTSWCMRPCCISPTSRTTRSTNTTKASANRWRLASRCGAIPTAVI